MFEKILFPPSPFPPSLHVSFLPSEILILAMHKSLKNIFKNLFTVENH
jgi:hypothetical protein